MSTSLIPIKRNLTQISKLISRQTRSITIPVKTRSGGGSSNNHRRRRRSPQPRVNHALNRQDKLLDAKISEMQQLSRTLKVKISKEKEKEALGGEFNDLDKPIEEDELDELMQAVIEPPKPQTPLLPLTEKDKQLKLFDTPARGIDITNPMLIKIGDSVHNIMNRDDLKWDLVIKDLYENKGGFKGLSKLDVVQFLAQIPGNTKLPSQTIQQIEEMFNDRTIGLLRESTFLMNFYANNTQIDKLESLYQRLQTSPAPVSSLIYNIMIKGYVNATDLKSVNEMLVKMQAHNLEPVLDTYTNILQLCIKTQDVKQGESIFQLMKFRSLETKPDLMAYNNIIQLQIKAKNVYKALDYYEELLSEGLEPNTYTLNALALACSRDSNFILKGWNYIEEISKRSLEPNLVTFEAMLRLAAKDGDLELARALSLKVYELQSENISTNLQRFEKSKNETLNYLMMAYRDYKPGHTPQSMLSKDISVIRRNTLRLVDFIGLHQNLVNDSTIIKKRENLPPFLPLRSLVDQKQIVAETKAIWNFNLIKNPSCLNVGNLITYLRVFVDQRASKEEFMHNFEQFTYTNEEIKFPSEQQPEASAEALPTETNESKAVPPVLRIVEKKFNQKLERESQLYRTLLSAGKRYRDLEMCEKAWIERGEYRKTSKYQQLSPVVQKKLDFEFAKEMVLAMIEVNELELAFNVVESSRKLFPWNFYILKPLYFKLKDNGFTELCGDVSYICNNAPKK